MKIITLTKKSDFLRMKEHGEKYHLPCSTIIYIKNIDSDILRIAFAISKKVANAVERNKARRQIREAVCTYVKEHDVTGLDVLFIPKRNIVNIEYSELCNQIKNFFDSLRLKK